jgi:ABC-type multidrug transport system fused ATPase/permease subunit
MVGQVETNLSGGEIALIHLLRLCIRKPPIIVLDEVNSALDAKTEIDVLGKVLNQFPQSTIILATHRLKAIEGAGLIICLKDGWVVESGTHRALVEQKGYYADLLAKQNATADL